MNPELLPLSSEASRRRVGRRAAFIAHPPAFRDSVNALSNARSAPALEVRKEGQRSLSSLALNVYLENAARLSSSRVWQN